MGLITINEDDEVEVVDTTNLGATLRTTDGKEFLLDDREWRKRWTKVRKRPQRKKKTT